MVSNKNDECLLELRKFRSLRHIYCKAWAAAVILSNQTFSANCLYKNASWIIDEKSRVQGLIRLKIGKFPSSLRDLYLL